MQQPKDLSLVVPCYQEGEHLARSLDRLIATLSATRWSYEIIFIDDCSTDDTRAILERFVATHPELCLRCVLHEVNQGRGATVSQGIHLAVGRVVGFIDIDLEVDCCYIPAFVLAIEQGADMAMAHRIYKLAPDLMFRTVLSRGYTYLAKAALDIRYPDTEAGYKFFNRERIVPILEHVEDPGWFWDTEIVVRAAAAGLRIDVLPTLFVRRNDKTSTVRVVSAMVQYLRSMWRLRRSMSQPRDR